MKNFFFIGIACLLFSSCATILNTRNAYVNIVTETPARVIVNNDTLHSVGQPILISAPRSKAPLAIKIYNDSITKYIAVKSRNSGFFWENIPLNLGIGMLVDWRNPKRYTYPMLVYVPMDTTRKKYLTYVPFNSPYKNNIKITPLRFLFSHPGIELSYERYFGKNFSTEISFAHLYDIEFSGTEALPSSGKGFQVSIDEKYFLRPSAVRPYVSIETGYFNIHDSHYADEWNGQPAGNYYGTKEIFYIIPKFGLQSIGKKGWVVEEYIGIGGKDTNAKYVNTESPYNIRSYNFWQAKASLNFKVGYSF